MKFSVSDKILFIIFFCITAFSALAQIEQEYLPHTHTLHEMTLRLNVLENNIRQIDPDIAVQELRSIREQCEVMLPSLQITQQQDARHLMLRTLVLEMVLNYVDGRKNIAESIADEVLRLDPAQTLSGEIASPELAEWFENIRDRHAGFLTVNSDPTNALVYLNGVEIGITPLEHTFVPVGTHSLRIMRSGFDVFEQAISIERNQTLVISSQLTRNSGNLLVWISPPGTSITCDSFPEPIVTKPLSPIFYWILYSMGFYPPDFSQPLIVQAIPQGQRYLSIEKECRKPIEYTITFDAEDYYLPLLMLETIETRIDVTTERAGKKVFVDGSFVGLTPLHGAIVCPGERLIKVVFDNKLEWSQTVTLPPDAETLFQAFPRPGVLFLGTASFDQKTAIEGEAKVLEWIEQSGAFNIMPVLQSRQYRLYSSVASVFESLKTPSFDPFDASWTAKLADMVASLANTDANLYVFARLVPESSHEKAFLFFIHRDSTKPDVIPLPTGTSSEKLRQIGWDSLLLPEMTRLRSGLMVTELKDKLFISNIIPGGPAENSRLQPGDIITKMNTHPVTTKREFEAILRQPDSPEAMPITCLQDGKPFETIIQMKRQPLIEALGSKKRPNNIFLAQLEILASTHTPIPDWLTVNAGVCCLAIGRPDKARDYFEKCSLVDPDGINFGTLSYLQFLAEKSLRNQAAADAFYKSAQESSGATIIHGDGPSLQSLLH
ncbi:MAG: PEGA domain-containing protein [bacterium]